MSEDRFSSVRDAIEDTPAEAETMRLRSALVMAPTDHIADQGPTQAQAARIFRVTQPRVSDLVRGGIDLFGIGTPVAVAGLAGLQVEMPIGGAA